MGYQNTVNVLTRSLYPHKLGPFKINKEQNTTFEDMCQAAGVKDAASLRCD